MILTEDIPFPETCGAIKEGTVQEGYYYFCSCLMTHSRTLLSPCQVVGKDHIGMPHKSVASWVDPLTGLVQRKWVDWGFPLTIPQP